MIKSGLLVFSVVISNLICFGQSDYESKFYFGLRSGFTLSESELLRHSGEGEELLQLYNSWGIKYGFSYGFYLNNKLSFRTGFIFGRQSAYVYCKDLITNSLDRLSLNIKNLEVPLLIYYSFKLKKLNPSIGLGLDLRSYRNVNYYYHGFNPNGFSSSDGKITEMYATTYWSYDDVLNLLTSFHSEIGVDFKLKRKAMLEFVFVSSLNVNKVPISRGYYNFFNDLGDLVGYGEFIGKSSYHGLSISYYLIR